MPNGQYDIVFWQNAPSIHQAPLIRALTRDLAKRVLVVAAEDISSERASMGWHNLDYGHADVIVAPSDEEVRSLADDARSATAHVFSGLGVYPKVSAAMRRLVEGPHGHLAVVAESLDLRGPKGKLRLLRFRRRRRLLRYVDTVLACGQEAARQFVAIKYDPSRIAAFGYFVDAGQTVKRDFATDPRTLRAIFVGSLTPWKDPLALVPALQSDSVRSWEIQVIGDGPLRPALEASASSAGIRELIDLIPSLPNEDVLAHIACADVLVLPSKYDGWGAVVSEALMVGTPAIVSAACGSSDLIVSDLQGEVIPAGRPDALAQSLSRFSASHRGDESRHALRQWSAAAISPRAAAEYLWTTVSRAPTGAIPDAPWRRL
jgi:glycosyltransferase involved in cell wall biosynthesis